jgi:hypothetical protein
MDRREMMGECAQSVVRALPKLLQFGLATGLLGRRATEFCLAIPGAEDEDPHSAVAFPAGPQSEEVDAAGEDIRNEVSTWSSHAETS